MKRVHIVGRKNHGKTTLVVELVQALKQLGLRVGTIKHTHHQHQLDTPGKDSYRHHAAGAEVAGICSPSMNAVFWKATASATNQVDKYLPYASIFAQCDLVLVEGDMHTDALKVEVWRDGIGTDPLIRSDQSIAAVVTDDDIGQADAKLAVWPRSDVQAVARNIITLLESPACVESHGS